MTDSKTKAVAPANPKGSGEAQSKKKKKNAPDRPQPAWLFPPDEENPVLNPKEKSQETIERETSERLEAIKFLKHKAVTAPVKPAPPTMLLTLIGGFLASYGFNSTGRLFNLERNARNKLDGWNDQIGAEIPKTMPDLVKIYKQWYKDWQDTKEDDGFDKKVISADTKSTSGRKKTRASNQKATKGAEDTSSSESDSESGEGGGTQLTGRKEVGSSSTTSSSESDPNDESGVIKATSPQPRVERFGKGLKRKPAEDTAESSSEPDSDFDSDSDRSARTKKRQKSLKETEVPLKFVKESLMQNAQRASSRPQSEAKATHMVNGKADSGSSSEASSDQDSGGDTKMKDVPAVPLTTSSPATGRKSSADSSATIDATSPMKVEGVEASASAAASSSSSSSSPSSHASPSPPPPPATKKASSSKKTPKRKRSASPAPTATTLTNGKAANQVPEAESNAEPVAKSIKHSKHDKSSKAGVPFQRIPENQDIDPRLASNAYVPYEYADKAHEDLRVTRGKGFTKEKNKKKRGAYRGGAIDVEGGKGIKFAD